MEYFQIEADEARLRRPFSFNKMVQTTTIALTLTCRWIVGTHVCAVYRRYEEWLPKLIHSSTPD